MEFLKIICYIILIYYVLKYLIKLVLPFLLKLFMKRMMNKFSGQFQQNFSENEEPQSTQSGKTTIQEPNPTSKTKKPNIDNAGEYVDFEEVK